MNDNAVFGHHTFLGNTTVNSVRQEHKTNGCYLYIFNSLIVGRSLSFYAGG